MRLPERVTHGRPAFTGGSVTDWVDSPMVKRYVMVVILRKITDARNSCLLATRTNALVHFAPEVVFDSRQRTALYNPQ
jgi:hypothetical protein